MKRTIFVILMIASLLSPIVARSQPIVGEWPTATPEEHGFDSALLSEGLLALPEQVPTVHSVLLVHEGELIFNASFFPYDGSTPHDLASVTKSYMTTLIGIAIDQGQLSLDDTVVSFFPDRDIANLDSRKQALTVGDLVSMRTGMACYWQPGEPQLQEMVQTEDWVQYTLDLPMIADPGTTWDYCSPGMHLLSAILTEATGMTALDFGWEHLFGPLGMQTVIWPADSQGYTRGWGDLILFPADAAKLGQLFLDGGTWDGQRIVSEGWVEAAITPQVQTADPDQSYGYGWWIMNESDVGGEIKASGRWGQYVAIYPALNLVVGATGDGDHGLGSVLEPLVPALNLEGWGTPVAANPEGVSTLEETIATLRKPPEPEQIAAAPAIAVAVSGNTYQLAPNDVGLATFSIRFEQENEAVVTLGYADPSERPLVIKVGLDGVYHHAPGDFGLPMAARGEWRNDSTFAAELRFVGRINKYLLSAQFDQETVSFAITDIESGAVISLEGTASPDATPVAYGAGWQRESANGREGRSYDLTGRMGMMRSARQLSRFPAAMRM